MRYVLFVLLGLIVLSLTACPKPEAEDNVVNDQAGMAKPDFGGDQNASTDSTAPPSDATAPPADSTTPPAEGTEPPAEGTTPPGDGTTPPSDGTTPPAGGENPPAGGETPPAEPPAEGGGA